MYELIPGYQEQQWTHLGQHISCFGTFRDVDRHSPSGKTWQILSHWQHSLCGWHAISSRFALDLFRSGSSGNACQGLQRSSVRDKRQKGRVADIPMAERMLALYLELNSISPTVSGSSKPCDMSSSILIMPTGSASRLSAASNANDVMILTSGLIAEQILRSSFDADYANFFG